MFQDAYRALMTHVRDERGYFYRRVQMSTGTPLTNWMDSLGAFMPGMQVLYGDLNNAMRSHEVYFAIWRRFNALPERFDFAKRAIDIGHYPLRPELIESTYMLYQATKDSYYLEAGLRMMQDLQIYTRLPCGFTSLTDVEKKTKGDRMESFFLGETLKYLFLIFDEGILY